MNAPQMPPGWRLIPIRDACGLINGRAFKPTDWTPEGLAIVRIQNLNDPTKPYNRYAGEVAEKHLIDTGELLFAWSGTPGTSFGAHVWRGGLAVLNQHIFRVIPNETLVDKAFLEYAINERLEELIRVAHGGAGLAHVTKPVLEATELRVPESIGEQRRIVAKLDALRARSKRAKEALDAVPALLDRLRQSILAAAFRGDLTADWREQNPDVEPASEMLERIRIERDEMLVTRRRRVRDLREAGADDQPTSALFGDTATRGWQLEALEGLCDPIRGIPYGIVQTGQHDEGGIPTVRCGDIKGFAISLADLKRVSRTIEREYARTRLLGGEVLLAIRGTVGQPAVVTAELRGVNISREVAMIPLLPDMDPRFVMYLLASPGGQALLRKHVKGVAQSGINLADLRALSVPVPPRAEQEELVARVESALHWVQQLESRVTATCADLSTLDGAVLGAAFHGELHPDSGARPQRARS